MGESRSPGSTRRRDDDRRCYRHSRRPAASVCVTCERPACGDCLATTRIGHKCRACAGTAAPARSRLPPVVLIAVGVVLGLLAVGLVVALDRETLPATAPREVGGMHGQPAAEPEPSADVTFEGFGDLQLTGTVDLPEQDGRRPAAVIVGDLGPTTRDGVARPDGQVDALYQDLGALLSRAGMVVLRYDPRGNGSSLPPPDVPVEFAHHVADAAAAVSYLRHRDDVDRNRIVVIGHDEGGLVALQLVADGGARPAALVLVATPGRAVAERSLEPAELAAQVDVPTLVVHGGSDPEVTESDVAALEGALGGPVEVVRAPSAGHTLALQDTSGGHAMGGPAAAARDEHALADLVVWLETTLGAQPTAAACAAGGHLATEGSGTRYDQPGGTPQPIRASGAGGPMPADYAFLFADEAADCAPARFDPCQPVHFAVNDVAAPAGGVELVQQAFARLGEATGITFIYDGTTPRLFETRPALAPGADPPPVLVSWERRGQGEDGRVVPGLGHPVLVGNQIVTGAVALNMDAVTDLNTRTPLAVGFGRGVTWGRVLLHELGHVLGLGHVSDRAQLMYAELGDHTSPTAEFGSGDLEGLRLVGREAGCLS